MIILGLDPGVRRLGFAIVEIEGFERCTLRDMGVLRVDLQSASMGERLEYIHENISIILKEWNPRWIGLEKAVNFKNVDSAFKLTEARGVIRLACHQTLADVESRLLELSPTTVKKESAGSGQSNKDQVQKAMAMRFANLNQWTQAYQENNKTKLLHDAYDALAIAWTTWAKVRQKQRIGARLTGVQRER